MSVCVVTRVDWISASVNGLSDSGKVFIWISLAA